MNHKLKFMLTFIFTYWLVDFTTGFNSDFGYWVFIGGPIMGAILYTISGLIFYYLIYTKKFSEKKLFYVIIGYALIIEIILKNELILNPALLAGGLVMLVGIYSLIAFVPKWIIDGTLKENWKKALPLVLFWLLLATIAYFINPHDVLPQSSRYSPPLP